MVDADKPRFVALLTGLAAVKPGGKLTPEALEVWWLTMRAWPLDDFTAAVAHLNRSVEFMPSAFHFEQLRKAAGEQSCAEAWLRVLAALRTLSRYEVTTLGARIDRVVRSMGGYVQLAMTKSDEMHFRERRFRELWEELGEVEEARIALPSLAAKLAGPQRAFTDARALVANDALRADR